MRRERQAKLINVIFLFIIVTLLMNSVGYVIGYPSLWEMTQASWRYLENAFKYYLVDILGLGIFFSGVDFKLMVVTVLMAFLVAAIMLYFFDEKS